MQSPWASWKAAVMVLTAVVGVALGAIGYHAPRLQTSIATTVAAGSGAAAPTDPKPATATGSQPVAAAAHPAATAAATSGAKTAAATGSATSATTPSAATKSAASQPAATRSASSSGSATGSASSQTAASAPGPLLSQTQYAPFAFQIYPGTPSSAASQALVGFQVSFKSLGNGKEQITIVANGQSQTASFNATDKLYFVETRMGDDGFGQDNNFGDDGFILTDAGGHIVGS
jgi:hypothetical protein